MTPQNLAIATTFVVAPIKRLKIGVMVWLDKGKDLSPETLDYHLRLVFNPDLITATKETITIAGNEPWVIGRHGSARECRLMAARQLLGEEPKPKQKGTKEKTAEQLWQLWCEDVAESAARVFSRVPGL